MLRTALKPRSLGLLLVALACIAAFVQLGRWQLGVAQDKATQEVLDSSRAQGAVDLDRVLKPHQSFPGELSARTVRASGHYAETGEVLIANRRLEGREGLWVITPFVTDGGGTLPVLRGFVTSAAEVPEPPPGQLVIEGGLAPGESPLSKQQLPAGQLASVDLAVLVNQWPGELYNAFVFLATETDPAGGASAVQNPPPELERVPTPTKSGGLSWRNASYAAQWWVFACFALWMWWRMVRDDHRRSTPSLPIPPSKTNESP